MLGRLKHVHFVGIGGVGMSGIALVLRNLGFEVSGSDLQESDMTRRLTEAGVKVVIGHRAENCDDAEVVVFSTAVPSTNPELEFATGHGIPVIRRAEMLAELMRMKFAIGISGSHGKTTVTSLVGHLLERAGLDPTTVVGGMVQGTHSGARLGQSEYLVAEADESDRSFLVLYPAIAVVTSIEPEHLDFYKGLADIKRTFLRFVNRVPFYGSVIMCIDSPAVKAIRKRVKRRLVTYSTQEPAVLRARDIQLYGFSSAFTLEFQGKEVGRFSIRMPGEHNVQNALAAIAVGAELGVDFRAIEQGLATFAGVHRRLEKLGEKNGVELYDDYGHHPTEVRVTIESLRRAFPGRKLWVVFQPHRYTRTKLLAEEFGQAFDAADAVAFTKVYAASEPEIEGVDEKLIIDTVKAKGREGLAVHHVPELEDVPGFLKENVRKGEVVLTLGAGSICRIGARILETL